MNNVQQFSEESLSHNIIAQRSPLTGNTLFYVVVHKESQSGFMFNLRMLVIQDKNFTLFYSKHVRPIAGLLQLQKKGQNPIKQQLSLLNCSAEFEDSTVIIRFIKDHVKKNWAFRFQTDSLALKWFVLFKDQQEKSIAKSIKSKSKDTASSNASEYASILSQSKFYQLPPNREEQQEERVEVSEIQKKSPK